MKKILDTPRGKILIRESSPLYAPRYRELRLEALQDSPIAFSADYQQNLNRPSKYWQDRLTMQPDEATIFFAEYEDRLIGMTGIERSNSPKTRHSAWIWGVYVSPKWRGQRIADELIYSCFEWANPRRIVIAKLGVAAVNQSAIKCYERCGFKSYGTEPRAVFYQGKYYDEYLMSIDVDGVDIPPGATTSS
jgi:RimJ/RimL family protein N-acetyltransferase